MDTTLFYDIINGNIGSVDYSGSYIGSYTYYYCSALIEAFGSQCIEIGAHAFEKCTNLISISFPQCTTINRTAFWQCSNLNSITFSNCAIIGQGAFSNCFNLKFISFPKCTIISSYAFYYCSRLESLYFLTSTVPTIETTALTATPIVNSSYLGYYGSIYVPSSLLTDYQTATNWSAYSDRMVGV